MRRMSLFVTAVAAVTAAGLLLTGCSAGRVPEPESLTPDSAESSDVLTIAIAGMVTPESGLAYYQDLSEYVAKKAGKTAHVIHKADYTQVNDMLKAGKVDVAFVCSGPYATGHDEFGLELLVAPVVNGRTGYYSYIIAPKSSPATSMASLKGKVFAFTDPESNTGYIVPNFLLSTMGASAKTHFRETFFTYGHDKSIEAVATGKADGAAVDSLIYDFLSATDPTFTSKTRIVEKSEEFAIPPVVVRSGLEPSIAGAVKQAFLEADTDPVGRALLDKMKIEEFVEIDDSAYDSIREMEQRLAD